VQTFITLTRDPRRLVAELGVLNSLAVALMMTSLVIAPPLWPFFAALAFHALSMGAFGAGSILWLALLGMERRRLMNLWPFLLLLPVCYLLGSVAAWMALYDLISRPYHWYKTEHGLAKTSRQRVPMEREITADALIR
jgi:hypothetical protein